MQRVHIVRGPLAACDLGDEFLELVVFPVLFFFTHGFAHESAEFASRPSLHAPAYRSQFLIQLKCGGNAVEPVVWGVAGAGEYSFKLI